MNPFFKRKILPCDDSICREHLAEREVFKENILKCKEFNREFKVTCDEFRKNKTQNKLVENQPYLDEEEIILKQEFGRINSEIVSVLRRIQSK